MRVCLGLTVLLALPATALAYWDPSGVSYLMQTLVALGVGAFYTLLRHWREFQAWLRGEAGDSGESEEEGGSEEGPGGAEAGGSASPDPGKEDGPA